MTYKTCVSVAEGSPEGLAKMTGIALQRSDLAELRLDFLGPSQVPDALNLTKKYMNRLVCTLRPRSQGGRFSGSGRERISILKLVAEYEPYLLDVEFETLRRSRSLSEYLGSLQTRILVSWHDFEKTPSMHSLRRRFAGMSRLSGHVKIVTMARSPEDSARLLGLYGRLDGNKLVAFSMGKHGRLSRILCLYLGSPFTYVSLGRPVAPGQFSLDELKELQAR